MDADGRSILARSTANRNSPAAPVRNTRTHRRYRANSVCSACEAAIGLLVLLSLAAEFQSADSWSGDNAQTSAYDSVETQSTEIPLPKSCSARRLRITVHRLLFY